MRSSTAILGRGNEATATLLYLPVAPSPSEKPCGVQQSSLSYGSNEVAQQHGDHASGRGGTHLIPACAGRSTGG